MNVAVAIGGLAFLILIHEAGHFFTALAVKMRPRKFYIFFPPALAKWKRGGIEYGIGAIPLGGYVKIPGMHKPAAGDLELHLRQAQKEVPSLTEAAEPVEKALADERFDEARERFPELRAAGERAELSAHAHRAAHEPGFCDPRARGRLHARRPDGCDADGGRGRARFARRTGGASAGRRGSRRQRRGGRGRRSRGVDPRGGGGTGRAHGRSRRR